jgi:hypothetical protein
VAELADRLGVDGRTVRRYVDHLLDLDVPVESVRGRYGGYRLAPGYRMPPLMLSDEEALAVLLGLVAGRQAGLMTATGTAGETAAAKIRRVLPEQLARRLDTVLRSLAFTAPPGEFAAPESAVLLCIADAVRHHRPVSIRYTAADGRRSERTLHPYGLVAHSGRWGSPALRNLPRGAEAVLKPCRSARYPAGLRGIAGPQSANADGMAIFTHFEKLFRPVIYLSAGAEKVGASAHDGLNFVSSARYAQIQVAHELTYCDDVSCRIGPWRPRAWRHCRCAV